MTLWKRVCPSIINFSPWDSCMAVLHLALPKPLPVADHFLLVDPEKYDVLGLQVSGIHISSGERGHAICTREIIHGGKKKPKCLGYKIKSENGKLISVTSYYDDSKEEYLKRSCMQEVLKHIDTIAEALGICLHKNLHFAAYKLPAEPVSTLSIQKDPEMKEL